MAAPLVLHRARVAPEWIDYNGHMNEAYYVLVFSQATDALMDHVGLDDPYRRRNGLTLYTLEAHVRYLVEVGVGVGLRVATRLLDHDAKRLHLHHTMLRDDDSEEHLATSEQMLMHIDIKGPRATPFAPKIAARIAAIAADHAALPALDGRSPCIAIRRRARDG